MTSLTTGQITRDLEGRPTTVIVQHFADRILVLVTQLGKIGSLIQASLPSTIPLTPPSSADTLPTPPAAIQLTTLLGSAPSDHIRILYHLYASQIATIMWVHGSASAIEASRRNVVVGLALQSSENEGDTEITENERRTFHGIMGLVRQTLSQA